MSFSERGKLLFARGKLCFAGEKLFPEPEQTIAGRRKSIPARYQLIPKRYRRLSGAYPSGFRSYALCRPAYKGKYGRFRLRSDSRRVGAICQETNAASLARPRRWS
jgi:hypothetical protein